MTRRRCSSMNAQALVLLALLAQLGCSFPSTSPIKETGELPAQPPKKPERPVRQPRIVVNPWHSGSQIILPPDDERTRSIPAPQSTAESEDAIRELAFRHLIYVRSAAFTVFFLAIDGDRDPSDEFRAFGRHPSKDRERVAMRAGVGQTRILRSSHG